MNKNVIALSGVLIAGSLSVAIAAKMDRIMERLTGYEEVPAVSTTGTARFTAKVIPHAPEIDYQLSYRDLQGDILQSHIHFGQMGVNGGISVFLCTNLGNGPAGTQPCPPPPATITGVITPDNVIGPTGQGIAPGEFAELLQAMQNGKTYVNVHSSVWPGGEIRSQIEPFRLRFDSDHH